MAYESETATAEPELEMGDDFGDTVVADIVANKQKNLTGETVTAFGEDVEKEAAKKVDVIRDGAGDAVAKAVGPEIMAAAEGYRESKEKILDPNATVGDGKSLGAAAFVKMENREKVFDADAMKHGMTTAEKGYWTRTNRHEDVHQNKQAKRFDADVLRVYDRQAKKVQIFSITGNKQSAGTVEGQSSMENLDQDIVGTYRAARGEWKQLTGIIGKGRAENMMQTGRVQAVQRELMQGTLGSQLVMQ